MIEIFILKGTSQVFKCLLPDGTVYEGPGLLRARKIHQFLDFETKVVYFPTTDVENQGTGEVEIQVYDTFVDAIEASPFLKKII